jgi:gliding motility-associated-like protein/uncharacterized repeat protein (TIGR01451 family)
LVADIPAPTGDPTQTYCDTEGLTFADAAVFNTTGFDGIYWYADAAQTTPIDPTTVVTTGTYYAFQGVGACADALAVSFTLVADIPAPTGDPTQTYCDTEGLTFADAAVFNTTGFDGIYWYADAAQTTPIDPTTVVTTGTYYAFQGVGACADALAVSFTLVADIPAPTGDPTQTYCDTEGLTFADAAVFNTTGFDGIYWYADAAQTTPIDPTTVVTTGTYYAFQGVGACADALAVSFTLVADIPAPTGDPTQTYCDTEGLTFADAAVFNTTGFDGIYWYADAAQTTPIDPTTVVTTGTYYAFQGVGACADALAVSFTLVADIPAPTGDPTQTYCDTEGLTFADAAVFNTTGFDGIYWYADAAQTTPIDPTTVVTTGTYYAFQGVGACADALAVSFTLVADIPAPTGDPTQTYCDTEGLTFADAAVFNTTGFDGIYWYADAAQTTPIDPTTVVTTGTYYAFQGVGACADALAVSFTLVADIPAPTGDPTQTYCDTEGLTFADAAVFNTTGFDGIYWYADAAQTTPIDPTTVVTTGTYYAFQGVGACADALAVSFTLVADIPAPTGDPTQTYCDTEGLTFADAAVFNTTGFDGIYWYADAAQTTPIDPTTVVTTGTYYAFQGVGACADALAVSFTLVADIPAPTGDPTQTYCDTEGLTFADAAVFNTTGFDGIYWYADAAQTTPIDPTTVVTTGTYYAFQGVGACADALAVSFTLVADIPAPTGDPTQTYCDTEGLTFADAAVFNTTGFDGIYWYADAAQTTPIDPTTVVTTGTYYAFQGVGACADALAVSFTLVADIPAPTGDIIVHNTDGFDGIYWYATVDQSTPVLNPNTILVNGTNYYAFQGIGTCATGLVVQVHLTMDIPAPTGHITQYFCENDSLTLGDLLVETTLTGAQLIWFAENSTNGEPLDSSSLLVDGSTYYGFQGLGECAESLAVTVIESCDYVSVIKVSDVDLVDEAGDIITYTISVTNMNILPVTNVVVNDPLLGGILNGPASGDVNSNGILDPYEVWIYNGSYTVTQDDIDSYGGGDGDIDNTVVVTVLSPNNDLVTNEASDIVLIDYSNNGEPVYTITKEADLELVTQPGSVITYTITVTNTANFALTNLVVDDPLLDNEHYVSGDTDNDGALDVNEIWIYVGTYTVTLEDLMSLGIDYFGNADGDLDIDNTVFVNAANPADDDVEEASASEVVLIEFIFIPDGFSPDDDDTNEVFEIIGLEEQYPDFTIRIYNRWGNLVYDYDNNGSTDPQWWDGISNGRVTINKGVKVPTGTYYYVIDFNDGKREPLVDWIYLTRSE